MPKPLKNILWLIFIFPLFTSCVNMKKAIYFNNIQDSTILSTVQNLEPVIGKNDVLSITVSSSNPEATQVFNMPNLSTSGIPQAYGYLVNQDGFIQFPLLGNIKANGLTKKQLRDTIAKELIEKKLLLDPIVSVRYLNFKVTVLGEVEHPAVINVENEKITLLEALGMAGDLTIEAKRNNVMVIREEENGEKRIKRLDLTSTEIFTSPYYYLKSNDIVYVEPNSTKVASTSRFTQILPIILSAATLIFLIVDHFTR
jgi:polysaccharide export outer membrane protein